MPPVQPVLDALADQQMELSGFLAPLDGDDWHRPTPRCPGWDVSDVVLHLAHTNEMAVASARGVFDAKIEELLQGLPNAQTIDDGAGLMLDRERGEPAEVVHARWRMSVDALQHALTDCDPSARVQWVAGQLSARTLTTTRLAETWIHTGDVTSAFDVELPPTDRLWHISRLAWRTLPYAFARDGRELTGPVAFELTGPGGDDWTFTPEDEPLTVVHGPAADLCAVAGQRRGASDTDLTAAGPDAEQVLHLVRTFA
jgi:uncharacterized protein (TIGR03084 family)